MHISKKLKNVLARAPVLFMLLLIITICHPVRADAKTSVTLEEGMDGFITFETGTTNTSVIETKGSKLKDMFKKSDGSSISGVKDNSQYFAYYKIDKKASNKWTWSTKIEYWHENEFEETADGNITVPQNPSKSSNVFFSINMESGNKGSGCGKQTFTKYRTTTTTNTWHTVGSGKTGTLHYFCIDDGTVAGNALNNLKRKQGSKDNTVKFYVSPVIHNSKGVDHYSLNSWYTNTVRGVKYYWADRYKANYKAHYNIEYILEIPTVKVTQNASLVGKKLAAGNEAFEYQSVLSAKSTDHSKNRVRPVKSTDYIFRPQFKQNSEGKSEQVLLKVKDLNGKTVTGQTVDYYPFEDKDSGTKPSPVELKSPIATKNTTNPTITYKVGGRNSDKWQSAVLVGFTVYKKVDTNDDGKVDKKIFIANTIVQMKKDTSGQFRPKYVEEAAQNFVKKLANEEQEQDSDEDLTEESGQGSDEDLTDDPTDDTTDGRTTNKELSTKQDTTDGDALAVPSNVLDWHVTLKKYSKRKKAGDKLEMPKNQVTLKYLGIDLNGTRKGRKAYLRMNKSQGIRNEDKDTTKEIVVDWLYAPVDTPPTVTLEQYYVDSSSGEKLNYSTKEDLDVSEVDSVLKYNHKDVNHVTPVLKNREVLAQVNYGDPWVSYSVKRDKNGAYKLKDGSTYPEQESVEEGESQSGLGTKFKDTKPVAGFTKNDLIPKATYNGTDGKTYEESYIPLVVSVNGKNTRDSCMNNYLYEVRVKTEYDGKWTKFTAKDIWGDCTRAKGKLTDDRGYVTIQA